MINYSDLKDTSTFILNRAQLPRIHTCSTTILPRPLTRLRIGALVEVLEEVDRPSYVGVLKLRKYCISER